MEFDRRASPRHPFFASAELTEIASGARTTARTRDLGANGCYLDTSDPLPRGTIVSIQISHQGQVFAAGSAVIHSHPGMGMGVKFIALESGCSVLLDTWLRQSGTIEARTSDSGQLREGLALMKNLQFD